MKDLIKKYLPKTYYADRNSEERIKLFVEHWRRLVKVNQELEQKIDSFLLEAKVMPNEVVAGGRCVNCKYLIGDKNSFFQCSFSSSDIRSNHITLWANKPERFGCIYFEKKESQREA